MSTTLTIFGLLSLILMFLFGYGISASSPNQSKRGLISGISGAVIFTLIFYGYFFFWKHKYTLTHTIIGILFGVAIIIFFSIGYTIGKKKHKN